MHFTVYAYTFAYSATTNGANFKIKPFGKTTITKKYLEITGK